MQRLIPDAGADLDMCGLTRADLDARAAEPAIVLTVDQLLALLATDDLDLLTVADSYHRPIA